ncbi:hypothetical protein GGD63_000808 [Bradyrhizobium sp. cir1]|uniref:hypothetical protein n=1 Tax=Bradyrhizobium sp. cir1 TaxID=1445730 RepID=UPI0016065D0C|nr:hypothetical protein [Bradyrhizobium sp. cir1]MBB4368039.1 hypothetical protein [Bradyrhizobium sp. cir1]
MLRVLLVAGLLALSSAAHSKESSPREAENKAEASQSEQAKGDTLQQAPAPFPFWMTQRPVSPTINVYTAKHAGEERHCAEPKVWKEWGSFAVCRSWEWIDAERIIAIWTVILGIATCALGIATWRLWRSTEQLVRGAEDTSERQLRAYLSASPFWIFKFDKNTPIAVKFKIANHGATPAHDMSSISTVHVWPYPLPGDWPIEPPPPVGETWSKSTVYSDTPAIGQATMGRALSLEEIRDLVQDGATKRVYVLGVVRYYDIFKKKIRTTRFCRSVTPHFLGKAARGETFENQDGVFEMTPRHNDSD